LVEERPIRTQVLKSSGARVAGAGQHVHDPVLELEERLDGVLAQVRGERHGIRSQVTEERRRVAFRGWADCPPLGVEDHEEASWGAANAVGAPSRRASNGLAWEWA